MSTFKQKFVSGNPLGSVGLAVGLDFHKTIDYDRKAMRKALNAGGALLRKEARRIVSRKAVSLPGEAPGVVTGRLMRSIGIVKRGSKGGWVKVGPRTIKGSVFYPAFLFYGRKKGDLEPRANFMVQALENQAEPVRNQIRAALAQSLVPRLSLIHISEPTRPY